MSVAARREAQDLRGVRHRPVVGTPLLKPRADGRTPLWRETPAVLRKETGQPGVPAECGNTGAGCAAAPVVGGADFAAQPVVLVRQPHFDQVTTIVAFAIPRRP